MWLFMIFYLLYAQRHSQQVEKEAKANFALLTACLLMTSHSVRPHSSSMDFPAIWQQLSHGQYYHNGLTQA